MANIQETNADQLQSVNRQTTSQLVYEHLREALHQGKFEPGQRLDQKLIADQLGTSRMPVREALNRLETEGFIKITPYQGAEVVRLSDDELEELYQVRVYLEGLAMKFAAASLDPKQLGSLREIVKKMEGCLATDNYVEYRILNRQFHCEMYEAANSKLLLKMVMDLWDKAELYRHAFLSMPERAASIQKEHREIMQALEVGDGALAEKAMRDHLVVAKTALLRHLKAES